MKSKYFVLLCDGLADRPITELGNKTIIEAANIPNINKMAAGGICGLINTVPEGMPPGSDVCNLSVFGYNPKKYYTGRSPIEAASMGIDLGPDDLALRCNMVTIAGNSMESFTAHHIEEKHGQNIIDALNEIFKNDDIEFYKGVGYRNLAVLRNVDLEFETTPPHDITGKDITNYLPVGKDGAKIQEIMKRASAAFDGRTDTGNATNIWLWGQGKKLTIPSFKELYGKTGAVISAVDLVRGIGVCAGLDIIKVPGMTGFLDTNFEGKAQYAIKALEDHDYVFVHVEAPDEAGHMGSIEKKIEAIESIDARMMPIIMKGLEKFDSYKLLITPDHPTPIALKTHSSDPIPAIIYGTGIKADENKVYSENIKPSFNIKEGYKIAEYLFNI